MSLMRPNHNRLRQLQTVSLGLLLFVFWPASDSARTKADADLLTRFPTLMRQLALSGASDRVSRRFLEYAAASDSETGLGMSVLLQEDLYGPLFAFAERPFVPDGRAGDWAGVPDSATDPAGDAKGELDLTAVRVTPDLQGNLRVLHLVSGLSSKKKETGVGINIFGLGDHWVQFAYNFHDNRENGWFNIVRRADNKIVKNGWIPLQYAAGDVVEAVIPLADFLKQHGIPPRDSLNIQPFAGSDTGALFSIAAAGRNLALSLAVHLAEVIELESGDTMPLALAVVNSHLYAIADEPTQRMIKSDIVAHHNLYRTIVAQMTADQQSWNLRNAPFIPKVFWADRRRTHEVPPGNEILNAQYYQAFIDRPETLAAVQRWIQKEGLTKNAPGLAALALSLERFYYDKAKYRSSIENLELFHRLGWFSAADLAEARADMRRGLYERQYLGKKRRWDGFGWLNYQWAWRERTGFFMGDCGTATTMQMALYRMAGLAPASFQHDGIGKDASASHNFPAYYSVPLRRWEFVQIMRQSEHPTAVHYARPFLHHARHREDWQKNAAGVYYSSYYQMEVARTPLVVAFLRRGVDHDHMQRMVLSETLTAPGLFFTKESTTFADSDGDGIQDAAESQFGTDPAKADTDGDGYSDLWELEHGTGPTDPTQPVGVFSLDGIVRPVTGEVRVASPKGDSKAERELFDAASLAAVIDNDQLLLSVAYHNDITQNKTRLHSFAVEAGSDSFWVQWYRGVGMVYRRRGSEFLPLSGAGLYEKTLTGAEFIIPLAHFGNRRNLKITYFAPGWFGGKDQIVADQAGPLELGSIVRTRGAPLDPLAAPAPGVDARSRVWDAGP